MTILKWLLIIVAVGYLGGLAALMLLERSFLYPIPTRERVAPATAGFPDVEEHVLTTADGEKIILWHMPAKPGRPVILYFHGNGDFLAGFFGRFRDIIADGTGVVVPAYRGYSGSSGAPSEEGLLRDAAAAYAFTTARCDGAGGRAARPQADPGSAVQLDGGCRRIAVLVHAGASRDAGPIPLRRADRWGQGPSVGHARHRRPRHTDPLW
jgi:hypothetical protein